MSSDEYSPDPSAVAYQDRLDVSLDADKRELRKAWKVASNQYHPDSDDTSASNENFLRIKDAKETLLDATSRYDYQVFCDVLGEETGTEVYEKWILKGKPQSPKRFAESIKSRSEFNESGNDDTGETRKRTEFDQNQQQNTDELFRESPVVLSDDVVDVLLENGDAISITWSNFNATDAHSNHWKTNDHNRLYLNKLVASDVDCFVNLENGQVLTGSGEYPDITIKYSEDEKQLYIGCGNRNAKLSLDALDKSERKQKDGSKDDSQGRGRPDPIPYDEIEDAFNNQDDEDDSKDKDEDKDGGEDDTREKDKNDNTDSETDDSGEQDTGDTDKEKQNKKRLNLLGVEPEAVPESHLDSEYGKGGNRYIGAIEDGISPTPNTDGILSSAFDNGSIFGVIGSIARRISFPTNSIILRLVAIVGMIMIFPSSSIEPSAINLMLFSAVALVLIPMHTISPWVFGILAGLVYAYNSADEPGAYPAEYLYILTIAFGISLAYYYKVRFRENGVTITQTIASLHSTTARKINNYSLPSSLLVRLLIVAVLIALIPTPDQGIATASDLAGLAVISMVVIPFSGISFIFFGVMILLMLVESGAYTIHYLAILVPGLVGAFLYWTKFVDG